MLWAAGVTTVKAGTLDSMKFKRLKRRLKLSDRGAAGLLEVLWQRCCKDCPRGNVGQFTNEEIAVMADYEGDADELVQTLVECRWLDESDEHRLLIHDWHEHAPNYVKGIVARKGGFLTLSPLLRVDDHAVADTSCPPPSLAKPSQVLPPPTPSPVRSGDDRLRPEWEEVEADLRRLGVSQAAEACLVAQRNGCEAEQAIDVVCHYRCRLPAWGPGALYHRVLAMYPRQDCSEGWPDPSPESVKAASRDASFRQHERVSQTTAEVKAAIERDRVERDRLEKEWGATLDAMPKQKIRDLITERFPAESHLLLARLPARGHPTGALRVDLLTELSKVPQAPTLFCEAR